MAPSEELRPLASALTELRAQGTFVLCWGLAGLAALAGLEDPSEVLAGALAVVAFLLLVWFPGTARARSRRETRSPAPAPAPPEARREDSGETVRRALAGRMRMVPLYVLLILLPSLLYGPSPGDGAMVAGAVVGILVGTGLEGLRRAVRLQRWQRSQGRVLLAERAPPRLPWRGTPRRLFSDPLPPAGRS